MIFHAFLIKYAEIAIKGKNRYMFEDALVKQMNIALSKVEGEFEVKKEQGRIYVFCPEQYDYDETVEALQHVFGIVGICPVILLEDEGFDKLAEEVIRLCEEPNDFHYCYEEDTTIQEKLDQIVQKVYGGKKAVLTPAAQKQAKQLTDLGFGNAPICMAKTQYSLTDDATKLGAPTDFDVTVRNLKISAGAGFIVALTGDIMTMPGLPKVPAANRIDVDAEGKITGLF